MCKNICSHLYDQLNANKILLNMQFFVKFDTLDINVVILDKEQRFVSFTYDWIA